MTRFASLIQTLQKSKNILIGSHYNPDGDAIGSMLALGLALESLGKKVSMFSRDGVPDNLKFLSGSEKIISTLSASAVFDAVMMVDVAHLNRVGGDFNRAYPNTPILIVDHHSLENHDGTEVVVDASAAATSVLIAELLRELNVNLTPAIADQLFTALVVDTGSFRYSATSSEVLSLAARLVEAGARPWHISREMEESAPLRSYKLLASSLATLHVDQSGQFAAMEITQSMLKAHAAQMEDAEEFAVYPRSIKGVEVSGLFKEQPDGKVRVSLRSKGKVDVANLARQFGGGGHAYAAGCTFSSSLTEAKKTIENSVLDTLKKA